MAMPLEKFKKVVEMARAAGSDGERENAMRIIERECVELDISVDDAMAGRFAKIEPAARIIYADAFRKMRERQSELNHRMRQSEERRKAYMEYLRRRAGR